METQRGRPARPRLSVGAAAGLQLSSSVPLGGSTNSDFAHTVSTAARSGCGGGRDPPSPASSSPRPLWPRVEG